MVTLFVSTAPHRIELQEMMGHIATLEQAVRAVHEGYLGHPLYHQAAHTAQRLLALVEAMEWDEGTRIAHEIACLFQTATTFGLVQALYLSELIAAFYRGIAQVSAEQTPYMERDVWGMAPGEWPPLRQATSAKAGSGTGGAGVAATSSTRLSHC